MGSGEEVTDPSDPRLGRGVDEAPVPQHDAYLVLSETERAQGFVRPVRRAYMHIACPNDAANHGKLDIHDKPFGPVTTMSQALAETYARQPTFYGATFCCACSMHRPVGENGEFIWDDGSGEKVGT